MERFRYHKEGEDKCRQGIGWKKTCRHCSYEMLCLFQQNQERKNREDNKQFYNLKNSHVRD